MIIAIIDDGLCRAEFQTPIVSFKIDSNRVIRDCTSVHCKSHGTFCGKIIETYGRVAEFIDIRILDNNGNGNGEDLLCALTWCLDQNINIINLSNGINLYKIDYKILLKLRQICDLLLNKGIIIFAAQSNNGGHTIPALFPGIISIEQYKQCYFFHEPDYFAEGRQKIIIGRKKVYTDRCNSYACAYACAQFSKYGKLPLKIQPNPVISAYELKKYGHIVWKNQMPGYITAEIDWWSRWGKTM